MKLLLTGYLPSHFVRSDGGRSHSKRPKQNNDCTVRALAIACGVSYDTAYDYLATKGRLCSRGFFLNDYLDKARKNGETILGYKVHKLSFPAVKGEERMYEAAFPILHPEGRYIIREAGHLSAVVDGNLHDTRFSPFRCVYCAWQFEKGENNQKGAKA